MPKFLTLMRMTPKGCFEITKSLDRGSEVLEAIAKIGVACFDYWATIGSHDCVMLFEVPDEAAMGHALTPIGTLEAVEMQPLTVIKKEDDASILAALAGTAKLHDTCVRQSLVAL